MVRVELDIDRSIEESFDYFSDFRNENEWNVVAHDIRLLTPEPIGVGSRFQGRYDKMGLMEYEILEYERPAHMLVRGNAKSFEWVSTFDFSSQGRRTHVAGTMDPHPKGVMKIMKPLMSVMIKGQMHKGLASLVRTLESKPAPPE